MTNDYLEINKSLWNNKVAAHYESEFYNMAGFRNGESSLNSIELDLLGNVEGKSILHLQCHFGQDSISLAKLGAKVTAVDFSDKAIDKAKELAKEFNSDVEFICCDLYNLDSNLDKKFDIVFTSYGTIGWLPDVDRWAKIVAHYLKPGGRLIFVDFHPFVWMYDNNFEYIKYSYFNVEQIVEEEIGTYADRNLELTQQSISWNHSLGEIFKSLLNNELSLVDFQEFDYSPYNCLNGMEEFAPKKYRISKFENKIPIVYSIVAAKLPSS